MKSQKNSNPLNDFGQISRVFYHELGHYTAFKLSSKHIKDFSIESISLYPCKKNREFLCGTTKPKLPPNYDDHNIVPKERLAYYLANQLYGCIFQIRFKNKGMNLLECLSEFGVNDHEGFKGQLIVNGLSRKEQTIFNIFKVHLEELKVNDFQDIENLNIECLLINNNESIAIDLERLEILTKDFISNHTNTFNKLIEVLNSEI